MNNDIFDKTHLVFVYGTLKNGYSNNHYLDNSKYLGVSETKEPFILIDSDSYNFPLLLDKPFLNFNKMSIKGDL